MLHIQASELIEKLHKFIYFSCPYQLSSSARIINYALPGDNSDNSHTNRHDD